MSDLDLTALYETAPRLYYTAFTGHEWDPNLMVDADHCHALQQVVNEIAAQVREQIKDRILADVHSEGNGVPFDSHYDVALVAAWIDEWFDR